MNVIRTLTIGTLLLLVSLLMNSQTIAQEVDPNENEPLNEENTYWNALLNWSYAFQYLQHLIENSKPPIYSEEDAVQRFLDDTCDLT